ncbi:NAD(P)-dependent oxidoreductase [Acholeplasma hippikon]|uniref:2-hydroxy-3-oxopropionate reductase n=1 Tax=Acholeplasma hippikon TaxID=264636 RepID=A0A449BKS0_9MOLU|nr:NAD(P)-dependent oxidoreductase [Acholeplasma hippikon]VEU82983.1 2-hydroxy-3-oxopropionate reductase [Acholeplasma hippikon]
MKIAWIGTGIMGAPMALHVAEKYDVTVYNRTFEKAKKLEPKVKAVASIEEAVKNADLIFTIVGYPSDVEAVYNEIFKYVKKGTICVDMTTSSPLLAQKLVEKGGPLGIDVLDSPVTGGDLGAKNATLSIMVGGNYDAFLKVRDVLKLMGTTINYVGEAGSGQYAKLSNQIAIAGALLGVAESLTFAKEKNLNLNTVYAILNGGSAQSTQLKVNGKKMIDEDFNPGFYVKHFLKDLQIAHEVTSKKLPTLDLAIQILKELVLEGDENLGTQSVIKFYQR